MNLNPNVEWDNLVTNDDLARLDVATRADIAALRAEIAELELRLHTRFVTVLLASEGVLLMALTLIIAIAVR